MDYSCRLFSNVKIKIFDTSLFGVFFSFRRAICPPKRGLEKHFAFSFEYNLAFSVIFDICRYFG